ncbi:MAG: putative methyltransferase [Pseudohongiellaceae bacterium]|jgi:predicted methyltransferase
MQVNNMKAANFIPRTFRQSVTALLCALCLPCSAVFADHHDEVSNLSQLIQASHRSNDNISRNTARHPAQTLEFFGLKPNMTAVEILPGGGWYTEILAPYLKEEGKLYAAHFSPNASLSYMSPSLGRFEDKLSSNPDLYGKTTVRHLNPPHETAIAPPASADMAMTFRNVHNWIMAEQQAEFFAAFYTALKPGGILGIVEHRAKPGSSMEVMATTGYVTEAYVKEIAAAAGFEFVGSSEINANAKDQTVYPRGVWTLPPTYQMGDENKAEFTAIGESDRMTLKFVKPM